MASAESIVFICECIARKDQEEDCKSKLEDLFILCTNKKRKSWMSKQFSPLIGMKVAEVNRVKLLALHITTTNRSQ